MKKKFTLVLVTMAMSLISLAAYSMCAEEAAVGVSACIDMYPRYTGDPNIDAERTICLWWVREDYDNCIGQPN